MNYELCNLKCPNTVAPNTYQSTNIWILSKTNYVNPSIFNKLILSNFIIDDLIKLS